MNLPLSFSPICTTNSIETTEQLFRGQLVESRIHRAGSAADFGVQMNGVSVGNSAVSFIKHRSRYEIECGDIDSLDSVIFSIGRSATSSLNGQNIDLSRDAAIITRKSNLKHMREAGSEEFTLRSNITNVEARLQAYLDRPMSKDLCFTNSVTLDGGIGAHGASTLRHIISSLDLDPTLLDNELIAANFDDLILGLILSLPNNYTEELLNPGRNSRAPASVSRAEEYMESNAHLPITITDVLSHASCSRKTLFSNFRRFREYTPIQFLVSVRLKLAHQRLRKPSAADSVTSIAHDSGFSHMGRFTNTYEKRYGVRPSETLRQGKASTS